MSRPGNQRVARACVADQPPPVLERRAQGSRTRLRARWARFARPKPPTGLKAVSTPYALRGPRLPHQRSSCRARRGCNSAGAFLYRPAVGMQPVARVRERCAEREPVQSGLWQRRGSRARLAPSNAPKRGQVPASAHAFIWFQGLLQHGQLVASLELEILLNTGVDLRTQQTA